MSYTARTLIAKAYYLSGIVSRSGQTVSGEQEVDGLDMLNKILASSQYDIRLIPYFNEYSFDSVAGQEKYFVPNLVALDTITYKIGGLRYDLIEEGRKYYFGAPRTDNTSSLPFSYHMERCIGGSNIYLYFAPSDIIPITLWGKFSFSKATLNDDLSNITDLYFIDYLEHNLALYICNFNNMSVPTSVGSTLEELRKKIFDVSPLDLTVKRTKRIYDRYDCTYDIYTKINYSQ